MARAFSSANSLPTTTGEDQSSARNGGQQPGFGSLSTLCVGCCQRGLRQLTDRPDGVGGMDCAGWSPCLLFRGSKRQQTRPRCADAVCGRARSRPDTGDAAQPPRLLALDGTTGAFKRTVLAVSRPPEGHPFQSVSFSSYFSYLIIASKGFGERVHYSIRLCWLWLYGATGASAQSGVHRRL